MRARADGPIAVVCGKGNNGGDGLVAARLLREPAARSACCCSRRPRSSAATPRPTASACRARRRERLIPARLDGAGAIVDAMLGTGFSGEPRDPASDGDRGDQRGRRRRGGRRRVDVPSGVDASTGEVAGAAVRAGATVTFHAAKPGLWIAPGKAHAGEVRVIDIGIPPGGPRGPDIGLIEDRVTGLLPRARRESTKFASGSVLVCGGSRGLTGAPSMASESAMRAGAGYVTALIPALAEPRCSRRGCSR